jgi:hypothetical protein
VKTVTTVLMLLLFVFAVACSSAETTTQSETGVPTTVMGIQTHPLPHNIPFE